MKALQKALACASFTLLVCFAFGQNSSWREALASSASAYYGSAHASFGARPDDVIDLEPFVVSSSGPYTNERLYRELDEVLNFKQAVFGTSGERLSIVFDHDVPAFGQTLEERIAFGGKPAYLAAKDIFEIDVPGFATIKAKFGTGVSYKLDNGWRFILKPSRKALVRLTKQF